MTNKISLTKTFVKRLDLVMTSRSISSDIQVRARILSELCGLTIQATRKWLLEKGMPEIEHLMKIAAHFSVTTSYLIGETAIKKAVEGDKNTILKTISKKDSITIDIDKNMFSGELKAGDTAICNPTKKITEESAIYLLQSPDKRYFRQLSLNENNLVIEYDENGEHKCDVYKDQQMIELFLTMVVGRVEGIIRKFD